MKYLSFIIIMTFSFLKIGFAQKSKIQAPEWSKNLAIYEVNLRQYTPEGTINAFIPHLGKLKDMGIGILWLMPIHPIGELNRKGTLGSYYSVKDYYGIDPALGTKDDFRNLVNTIHSLGMYVIIDWVANHTAWDNELLKTNPKFYTKDKNGNFMPPVPDWQDVVDLNYDNKELHEYMAKALEYWVKEFNIDGYRCDVAGMVPIEFWRMVRPRLDKIKPVFMLAEWEDPVMHKGAFDMTYSWDFYHAMVNLVDEKIKINDIITLIKKEMKKYPKDAFRMRFTTNHDENSWNGTSHERFKANVDLCNVLAATVPGMFLVYSGQEAGETKRLSFFEKDPIHWEAHPHYTLFQKLITLKRNNNALWNGNSGGTFKDFISDDGKKILAFSRVQGRNTVIVLLNFSDKEQPFIGGDKSLSGTFFDLMTGAEERFNGRIKMEIPPHSFKVLVKK